MSDLTKYRPMTEAEIRMAVHVAIIINLGKLPQLKGAGKANAEQREIHICAFVDAVVANLKTGVKIWMASADPNNPDRICQGPSL